ncbi:sugar-binding domain-containing protein [uncultured Bacteroides sp.]|uniref:sugar-binding domain-containing protein n=1 Tax=uncultured Bacteroides sp. TaxID=162156 RepID=UPI0025E3EBF5|nr:sugar-binding domain-containing protein [uncultured Bacteroides sp.]
MIRFLFCLFFCLESLYLFGAGVEFSTAGFYPLPGTGRQVYSLNPAWRFHKGEPLGDPSSNVYEDGTWDVVSLPHGLEHLPVEASGCMNYQGVAWYRKHFIPADSLKGKKLFIHFEGIMGKSEVYLNGVLLRRHYGGYLPVIVDVSTHLKFGEDNVIAVKTDNSDDPTYPVGKAQNMLDFTYFGGIYRDCWLVSHREIFVTHANYENEVAGGGLFVSFDRVSEAEATVRLQAHIRNESTSSKRVTVEFVLKDKEDRVVAKRQKVLSLKKGKAAHAVAEMNVESPHLWAPEHPYLYNLELRVKDACGTVLDGYRQRVGVRSIEFKKTGGLWINGKHYQGKIMGTNRHQDFAVLGNALPNSLQWRDAKKLRDAGMKVIRTHYVIDPAFMDACDELGLFALVETPGWQFWSDEPIFGERVYEDVRQMVRLHRNHASLFFWEPILNETHYPEAFAKKVLDICEEEYPYPYSVAACDYGAAGDHYYELLLRPVDSKMQDDKTYFIREWGDNVDDWNAQNSDSRVARGWGEVPMLIQAEHYACPDYSALCYESICQKPDQIVGACFWHSFDHQRGYHADPFYGGMMDAFRQPKTSYYMFMSQREPVCSDLPADNGPMIYIAHELTPFSPRDVTVYSNCDEVRLTVFQGGKTYTYRKDKNRKGMPSPIICFKDAFHFMEWKGKARARKHDEAYVLAEGLMDGKVVATHKRYPAGQPHHIRLRLDDEQVPLQADGSDVVVVVAEMVDKYGNVKRLNNSYLNFTVEGEGRLLGEEVTGVNPAPVIWGTAPALIQSTTRTGKIKVTASMSMPGECRPLEGTLEFETVSAVHPLLYQDSEWTKAGFVSDRKNGRWSSSELEKENARLRKELHELKVKEVEKQQTQFGGGIND